MINIKNFRWTKAILIFTLFCYVAILSSFLKNNAGLRRHVTINSKQLGGVVLINGIKYPTLNEVRIGWTVTDPIDYLFLSSDEFNESVAGALLKLSIAIVLSVFLWWVDFNDPFQRPYFNLVKIACFLIIMALLQELIKDCVSNFWLRDELRTEEYRYSGHDVYALWIWSFVVSTVAYIYGQVVKNKEELALTI